ncbi:hypothetical protein [Vagococcus lutrae]|uniref:hypothetical protein n=1 Tax=Vagococcus lutrae TaxID=81947 RepID=UPI00288D5059|nr:hypothetical protein [Vagococcus lutrae]MDT2844648.1 hypothetical protein [Vagococcus lutrae]
MRNKEQFIKDTTPLILEEYRDELDVVEDAAFIMDHTKSLTYTLPSMFTIAEKDVHFKFEKKKRPKTDNPDEEIEDYFYVGRVK